MFWSLSMQLMPDETILEDSTAHPVKGVRPAYSVFLTNKRVVFRFDGLGSSMTQSFLYHEITDTRPSRRMLVTYLEITAGQKEHYLHIAEPEYWAGRIAEIRTKLQAAGTPADAGSRKKKEDLLTMLSTLHANNLLTDSEFVQKKQQVESLPV